MFETNESETRGMEDQKELEETNKSVKNDDDMTITTSQATEVQFTDPDSTEETVSAMNPKQSTEIISETPVVKVGNRANKLLPGQSESGKPQSTTLTSREFTKVERKRVAAQKFPCIVNRLQKKYKKVHKYISNIQLLRIFRMAKEATFQNQMSRSKITQTPRDQEREKLSPPEQKKTDQIKQKLPV